MAESPPPAYNTLLSTADTTASAISIIKVENPTRTISLIISPLIIFVLIFSKKLKILFFIHVCKLN